MLKTHCKRGHEFIPENTYVAPKTGYRACVTCQKIQRKLKPQIKPTPEKAKIYRDKWTEKNPDYFKRNDLKRLYGLTLEQFNDMLTNQDSKCAICQHPMTKVNVDHDHSCCPGRITCGKCIRGLLCDGCNTAIGRFKDDPNLLRTAIAYLEK